MHERSSAWWERIVNQCLEGRDWLENFRMFRDTFLYLCEELKPGIERQDSVLRRAIRVQQRVAIALWKLATNSEYRSIGPLRSVKIICLSYCLGCLSGYRRTAVAKVHSSPNWQ